MQGRSWMAALTLAVSLSAAVVTAAEGDRSTTRTATPKPSTSAPTTRTTTTVSSASPETKPKALNPSVNVHVVKLDLKIAGLTSSGCEVEIKPAHPGCKFQPRTEHVDSKGMLMVKLDDVEILNADRDCTFAITIREAGQAEKTWRRGLRLNATTNVAQTLPCFLSSPSKLARAMDVDTKTKR
jgi:hypothetical protein